jgi:hypothetical protein
MDMNRSIISLMVISSIFGIMVTSFSTALACGSYRESGGGYYGGGRGSYPNNFNGYENGGYSLGDNNYDGGYDRGSYGGQYGNGSYDSSGRGYNNDTRGYGNGGRYDNSRGESSNTGGYDCSNLGWNDSRGYTEKGRVCLGLDSRNGYTDRSYDNEGYYNSDRNDNYDSY